jgi:hypothetical protein
MWRGKQEHFLYHSNLTSERNKQRWANDKEYRLYMTNITTKAMHKPEIKAKAAKTKSEKSKNDPIYKQMLLDNCAKMNKKVSQDIELKQYLKKLHIELGKKNYSKTKNALNEGCKKYNNSPEGKANHQYWGSQMSKNLTPEKRRANTIKQWENIDFKNLMKKSSSQVLKKLWKQEDFRQRRSIDSSNTCKKLNKNEEQKLKQKKGKINKILSLINGPINEQSYEQARKQLTNLGAYPSWVFYSKFINNHKILLIKTIKLEQPQFVYDVTIDNHENFALTSGVFVHNSKIKNIQRLGRGLRRKTKGYNRVYVLDFEDRTHVYFNAQYKKRKALMQDIEATILDSEAQFLELAVDHCNQLKELNDET